MTNRRFRVDEANQELRFALSVDNSLRTVNPSDGAPPTEFARSGIKEEISDKYKKRYEEWKSEYFSTEAGRNQWEIYEHKKRFLLTIRIFICAPLFTVYGIGKRDAQSVFKG